MAKLLNEDIIDAISEGGEGSLELLSEHWRSLNKESGISAENLILNALECAGMLYGAKKYQETIDWLDATTLEVAKTEGEESDTYSMFVQDERLENMRADALDRSGLEDEDENDFEVEDE